jgi:GNAT superfamily N-acetyltransferase
LDRYPSETIEAAALTDLHAAATPALRRQLGLELAVEACAVTSVAAALPASAIVINRALGFGLDGPASRDVIEGMVGAYHDAGVARFFIQRHPDAMPADIAAWLESMGLLRARGWQKFERGRVPAPEVRSDLAIRPVGQAYGAAFADIVCDAFDLGDVAKPWLAELPGRAGWHIFMSFDGDTPAGTGALFVQGDHAWSDFGATAPAFRRRGSQGAVLARRIDHAIELGCERIFTCTGEDVAGDPQHSYRNILRLGFEPTYIRENYAPA